jgi:hypothetical protein
MWNDRLSQRWARAWSARDVEQLVWMFSENATYKDATFDRVAQGRRELRLLFSDMFHRSDLTLKITDARGNASAGVTIAWIRSGSRVAGIQQKAPRFADFRGESKIEGSENSILTCTEFWKESDLEQAFLGSPQPVSGTGTDIRRHQGIIDDEGDQIVIGGVRISRNAGR